MGKQRNESIDVFRGFAMLLVVLGHTISGCAKDYEDSIILNIIWTLQMPLFIIISGYVTIYSRKIKNLSTLISYLSRRTCSYMIPWIVWTFLIRGLIFNNKSSFDVKHLLWNMDTGYWFLFTIWTISIIFGFAQYLSSMVYKKDSIVIETMFTLLFTMFGTILLAAIGFIVGLSFLCIKLTLYYIPFFCCGYLFAVIQKRMSEKDLYKKITEFTIALSALIYVALILRFNFFMLGESIFEIGIRITASILGCITVFGIGNNILPKREGDLDRSKFFGNLSLPLSVFDIDSMQTTSTDDTERNCSDCGELHINNAHDNTCNKDDSKKCNVKESIILEINTPSNSILKLFAWCGVNSLEIYVIHGLFLHLLTSANYVYITEMKGFLFVIGNYIFTLLVTICITKFIKANKILNKILFWK